MMMFEYYQTQISRYRYIYFGILILVFLMLIFGFYKIMQNLSNIHKELNHLKSNINNVLQIEKYNLELISPIKKLNFSNIEKTLMLDSI